MSRWIAGLFGSSYLLSFLRKYKILLPSLFEVFWINSMMYVFDYVKMHSVLKINFLLNIDPLGSCPMPVANTKNSYL